MDIKQYITDLPISAKSKIMLYNKIRRLVWKFKYNKQQYKILRNTQPFIPSNGAYGHEYWLKKYANYEGDIKAMIEHGVYFGNNKYKIGFKAEWEIGGIITYGDSRETLLKSLYPNYKILSIGPRIHYSPVNKDLYDELTYQLYDKEKTVVVFPAHSLDSTQAKYDIDNFIKNIYDFIEKYQIGNVVICLHPADYGHKIDLKYKDHKFILTGAGNDTINFLPRLKAIFSIADITYSNSLGTHIGYSIYMNVPHVLDVQQVIGETHSDDVVQGFYQEQSMFEQIFSKDLNMGFNITDEQRKLCDYYWGFSKIKSPFDLHQEFVEFEHTFHSY